MSARGQTPSLSGKVSSCLYTQTVFEYHSSVQDMMTTTLLHSQCCTSIIISIWVFYDLSQHTRQTTLLVNATISKILYWLYRLTTSFYCNTHPLNGPFSGTIRVSQYQKVKPVRILLKQETASGSGISICKSAPRSRQITTLAPHHSVFYRPDALPATQPTVSKHWRHFYHK